MIIHIVRPRPQVKDIPVGQPFKVENQRFMVVHSPEGGHLTQQLLKAAGDSGCRLVVNLDKGELRKIPRTAEVDEESPQPKLQAFQSIPRELFFYCGGLYVKDGDHTAVHAGTGFKRQFDGNEMVELIVELQLTTL